MHEMAGKKPSERLANHKAEPRMERVGEGWEGGWEPEQPLAG